MSASPIMRHLELMRRIAHQQRSCAEAAEAELEEAKSQSREMFRQATLLAQERDRLQAEVARLKAGSIEEIAKLLDHGDSYGESGDEWSVNVMRHDDYLALKIRIAELEAGIRLVKNIDGEGYVSKVCDALLGGSNHE